MHSGPPLICEDHKMVLPFRRSFGAVIFVLAAPIAAGSQGNSETKGTLAESKGQCGLCLANAYESP